MTGVKDFEELTVEEVCTVTRLLSKRICCLFVGALLENLLGESLGYSLEITEGLGVGD